MRPRPKKPGETVAEYNAFIANMPNRGGTPPKPKPMPPKPMPPSGGGRVMGGPATKMGSGPAKTGAPVMRAKGGMVKGKKK
jgi:hypothetical protein